MRTAKSAGLIIVSKRSAFRPALIGTAIFWLLFAATVGAADAPKSCAPVACVSLPRPQDEVWLVSTRGVGCGDTNALGPKLVYWRLESPQGWVAAGNSFWSSADPTAHVSIFVHGNTISYQEAFQCGWAFYRALVRSDPEQPPVRFVIWSWPSERVAARPAEDVRAKCARSDVDARLMAWFIDRLDPHAPLSLGGYSLGARIVGGALQLLGGGTLNGQARPTNIHPQRDPARVVMMAAAIDNDWLLPGRRLGLAMGQMEHLMLVNNGCDRVLRFYHRIYCRRGGPEALGYTGLAGTNLLGAERSKLEQFDVCCQIGPQHNWTHYVGTPSVANLIGRGLSAPAQPVQASARESVSFFLAALDVAA